MSRLNVVIVLGILSLSATIMKADQLNVLGAADLFSVLGAQSVTNTGATVLAGDLGVSPGSSLVGFPPGKVGGSTHKGDTLANTAETNALAGYNTLHALTPTLTLSAIVGNLTLTPGVYDFSSAGLLTGNLILNFNGESNKSFVFQTGSSLITASGSVVSLLNEGTNDSVYWAVGSSAVLGTITSFEGNILALQSVTLDTGATIGCGNAIALHGAVTLDSNTIGGSCATGDSTGTPTPTTSPVPEPASLGLVAIGMMGAAGVLRRKLLVSSK